MCTKPRPARRGDGGLLPGVVLVVAMATAGALGTAAPPCDVFAKLMRVDGTPSAIYQLGCTHAHTHVATCDIRFTHFVSNIYSTEAIQTNRTTNISWREG